MNIRIPDLVSVYYTDEDGKKLVWQKDNGEGESTLSFEVGELGFSLDDGALTVSATARCGGIRFIKLRFLGRMRRAVRVLGDAYERAYGDLLWQPVCPEKTMPWYIAVSNGSDSDTDYRDRFTECFGVKVCPNAICFWQYDGEGVTLWLDVRCGGEGVRLGGRSLELATVLFREYREISAYSALCAFAKEMCPEPYLPDHKVYGSNNWYYAYGKSSHAEIIEDSRLLAELCRGNENAPYMVIDDGWQPNPTDAPWNIGNERFPDMKGLADSMRAWGVRPGIWVRFLVNGHRGERRIEVPESWYIQKRKNAFDPSHPEVLDYVAKITDMLTRVWGYELIKHDFSTFDIFGRWGTAMTDAICDDGWSFFDKTKTTAEIIKNFYKTIKDNANGAVIIGCNCIGHLCATYHQLNRTGDDTSGRRWSQTVRMGVNSLAYRGCQNGAFYMADADCVGITGQIPWEYNREWLKALSVSGTPMFVSCKPGVLGEGELAELREAYRVASYQADSLVPLDWMETATPEEYLLNGERVRFSWYGREGSTSFDEKLGQ